jgi:hypothetical protein
MKRACLVMFAIAFVALILSPVVAHGQTIKNPRGAEFEPSPDHAQITKYVIGFFLPGATDPVQTQDLGKPTPNAQNIIAVTINVQPLTFGAAYTAKVQALAGTLASEWSLPSNPFDRAPGPPSKPPVVK